jgi:Uncharacterised nucleotidyltransferase
MSRLLDQLCQAIEHFERRGIACALIGGLALAAHKVIRATQDVDLLVDADSADAADATLIELGYVATHRSADAANYMRADERLDLLYASRPIARHLLNDAGLRPLHDSRLRVVSAEGLIGFKLQALVNNPRRTQDLEDIRALMRAHAGDLDMDEVRSYFSLFQREALLDELQAELR